MLRRERIAIGAGFVSQPERCPPARPERDKAAEHNQVTCLEITRRTPSPRAATPAETVPFRFEKWSALQTAPPPAASRGKKRPASRANKTRPAARASARK